MRVLVTGGAGFIGSHVADHLARRGDHVTIIDDLSTGVRANLPREARFEQVDICDRDALRDAVERARAEVVVHAAAQFSVARSVRDPQGSARINVQGTRSLLDLVRGTARRFVFLSTGGAIYGETPRCADEDTPLRPISPYGAQKAEGEQLVQSAGIPYAILRPANVYGPRQRGDLEGGVVAAFLQRYRERRELVVYGDGSAERDYVHVTDVADCIVAATDRSDSGTWNVGTGVATSIRALMDLMRRHLGEPPGGIRHEPARPADLTRACVNPSRAIRDGMFRPRTLQEGLAALLSS